MASLVKWLDLFQPNSPFLYTLIFVCCPCVCMCNWRQGCCPLYWTHWVRCLLWPVACAKWRNSKAKGSCGAEDMVCHGCTHAGIHTTALKLCITICTGIHLTQLQTSKPHLNQSFSLYSPVGERIGTCWQQLVPSLSGHNLVLYTQGSGAIWDFLEYLWVSSWHSNK